MLFSFDLYLKVGQTLSIKTHEVISLTCHSFVLCLHIVHLLADRLLDFIYFFSYLFETLVELQIISIECPFNSMSYLLGIGSRHLTVQFVDLGLCSIGLSSNLCQLFLDFGIDFNLVFFQLFDTFLYSFHSFRHLPFA